MKQWRFEQTSYFKKNFEKLIPDEIKEQFRKQIKRLLTETPYCGKPLGYKFFREKKIKKWRIYYLIYDTKLILFFADVSDKKLQQESISRILNDKKILTEYILKKYS